jgi:hypothetical protein
LPSPTHTHTLTHMPTPTTFSRLHLLTFSPSPNNDLKLWIHPWIKPLTDLVPSRANHPQTFNTWTF